jgi:hypothetical protein
MVLSSSFTKDQRVGGIEVRRRQAGERADLDCRYDAARRE